MQNLHMVRVCMSIIFALDRDHPRAVFVVFAAAISVGSCYNIANNGAVFWPARSRDITSVF